MTEFSYRFETNTGAKILMSFQPAKGVEGDFEDVLEALEGGGFECLDVSHNELAKVHVRHFGGGRSDVEEERLFMFEFPESPGALQRFLHSLDMSWNVSLFHYRNHGDDFGRVLVGIQSGTKCDERLQKFLDNLGYQYTEETHNPAYLSFLRSTS